MYIGIQYLYFSFWLTSLCIIGSRFIQLTRNDSDVFVFMVSKLKLQCFGHLMGRADSLKRPRCWERLRARGEGNNRGWDGWMASPTQWTWVWVDSGSWWWTGKPGVLRFMGSQRVGHDWATELNWIFHFVYVPQLLYPSSFSGHLGSFRVLAIVNSAAMNTGVHVYFSFWFPQGTCLEVGLLDHVVGLFLVF